jgi:uncharacterized repeat protein (TIGR01451 family)
MPDGRAVAAVALVLLIAPVAAGATATVEDLSVGADGGDVRPGETVTVTTTVTNEGENGSSGVVVDARVPDGWTVAERDDDGGTWRSSTREWLWLSVDSGESVSPSVTLRAPENASGEYAVSFVVSTGDSDGNATAEGVVTVGGDGADANVSGQSFGSGGGDRSVGLLAAAAVVILALVGFVAYRRR